jgi:ketosteroid isomerase-like protein
MDRRWRPRALAHPGEAGCIVQSAQFLVHSRDPGTLVCIRASLQWCQKGPRKTALVHEERFQSPPASRSAQWTNYELRLRTAKGSFRRNPVIATSPEQAVQLLDRAFKERDIETVLSFYEDAAVVVVEPGQMMRGTASLRGFFEQAMSSGASATQLKTWSVEADGVALFVSRWVLSRSAPGQKPDDRTFVATTVFRKQPNGGWKILIDNPIGPQVLGP